MKITAIEPILVGVPFVPTDGDSGFGGKAWKTVDTLLVRVDTDEGITGWGEAFGYNIIPGTIATLTQMIAPQLIGCDATAIGPLMAEMHHRFHLFGRSGPAIFGLSGVDIALWDIAGKRAGLPVHQLLGGAARHDMPCYASLMPYRDVKRVATVAARAAQQGYEYIKLHEIALPEVRAARAAMGPDIRMMVDTNCPWHQYEAVAMAQGMRDSNLYWLEEPIWPPENYAGLAHVRRSCGIPIAAGENCTTAMSFQHMFEAGAVDIAQPSPTKVGGLTELRKVAEIAAVHNVRVIPHTPYFGPGYLAGMQFTATLDRETPVEWLYVDMETTLYGDAIIPKRGRIRLPSGPGLGMDPDPDVIKRFRQN